LLPLRLGERDGRPVSSGTTAPATQCQQPLRQQALAQQPLCSTAVQFGRIVRYRVLWQLS
jgi:hypothetical protein